MERYPGPIVDYHPKTLSTRIQYVFCALNFITLGSSVGIVLILYVFLYLKSPN
jgi:hypothetical protein